MPQSTCARPRKSRSTWSPPILEVWDSGEAPGDKRTHPSSGRHQKAGSPVASVGSKTLLGAELELKLMRVVAEMAPKPTWQRSVWSAQARCLHLSTRGLRGLQGLRPSTLSSVGNGRLQPAPG